MTLRGEGVKGHDANFSMNFEPSLVLFWHVMIVMAAFQYKY